MYAEEDKRRKEAVDARNELDHMIFSLEKFMRESPDKLTEEDKAKLNADLDDAKKLLTSEDTDEIKAALNKLRDESAPIFTKMYQQDGGAAGGETPENGEAPDFTRPD